MMFCMKNTGRLSDHYLHFALGCSSTRQGFSMLKMVFSQSCERAQFKGRSDPSSSNITDVLKFSA